MSQMFSPKPAPERAIREWKRVIAPLLRQTGWKLMGFDPGFLLETGPSATVQLSVDQVADLIHAVAPL